jgi:hypothetical protein
MQMSTGTKSDIQDLREVRAKSLISASYFVAFIRNLIILGLDAEHTMDASYIISSKD